MLIFVYNNYEQKNVFVYPITRRLRKMHRGPDRRGTAHRVQLCTIQGQVIVQSDDRFKEADRNYSQEF